MKNTKKMISAVALILAVAVHGYAQRFKTPSVPTSTPTHHAPQTQSRPASTTPARSTQKQSAPATPTHSNQTQSQPRPTAPAQTPRQTVAQSQPQHAARPAAAPRPSQKAQARQQKELQKQQQKQQKDNARQQKGQQKQRQQQQKEQVRQQKEQQKQQQKLQKDQARQQKEQQKHQSKKAKVSAPGSAASNSTLSSSSAAKNPTTNASSANAPASSQAQATIQRLNSARSSMSGFNRKPLPSGELTVHSNGRMTLKAENGRQYGIRSNGTVASYSDRTKAVSFDQRGRVQSIHTNNMDIHHGTHGQRTIVGHRADGSKVVSTGPHSGYVERSSVVNNKAYIQRTTVTNNRAYTTTFIATSHGGLALTAFVPPVYFAPGFYGWAYYPWAAPISFSWGWLGAPWYLGPNPYFVASPFYPSASYWLTDYMIGETIATAYQAHKDAPLGDADVVGDDSADVETTADDDSQASSDTQETIHAEETTPITMEIKTELAEEVKQELANDNAEAARSGLTIDVLPAALHTKNHVFVVSDDLGVTTADEQLCALQAGDMLQLLAPADTASFVQLRVASSKRTDCPAGTMVSVSLPDVQAMENSFQAKVEAGLEKLNNDQGMAGLPGAPKEAVAAPPRPAIEGLVPVSTEEPSKLLDQERQQADEAEAGAVTSAF